MAKKKPTAPTPAAAGWESLKLAATATAEDIKRFEDDLGVALTPSHHRFLVQQGYGELKAGKARAALSHIRMLGPTEIMDACYEIYETYSENIEDSDNPERILNQLMPFAEAEDGNFWCFDFHVQSDAEEYPVYLWEHDTLEETFFAADFVTWLNHLWANPDNYMDLPESAEGKAAEKIVQADYTRVKQRMNFDEMRDEIDDLEDDFDDEDDFEDDDER